MRHKMKRIQAKKHKIGTNEIDKIWLSCFNDKRHVLDDGIYTLAYFYKDSVTSCKKIKKIVMIKKHCADCKILWSLKNIAMIEKCCDHWKIF